MWRYREAIGVGPEVQPVTLGEGYTPILTREVAGLPALFKLEYLMPTGSFKDRGASVVISHLASAGVAHALEDSSGNAGLAMAAYGTHAGIAMDVFVPDDAPLPKLAAIEACGGRLNRIPGGRAAAADAALRRAESGIAFASHVWNPLFLEGTKTFAYEIWEQGESRLPPRVFLPVGNGTLILGAFDGFTQLREEGMAHSFPRLMGVQAAACSPLVESGDEPGAEPGKEVTVADGLRVGSPPRARRIREAVRRSGGAMLSVSEEQILSARMALGHAGLDVEPSAAVALAGALTWFRHAPEAAQEIDEQGPPLLALTGAGTKVAR